MNNLCLWSEEKEADNSSEIMDHENSMPQQLKKDLLSAVELFHNNLTSWHKSTGNESFKIQFTVFLTNYIQNSISDYPMSSLNHTKNLTKQNHYGSSHYNEELERIQKNRDVGFVQLCKEIFEYVNEHEIVVGGLLQARVSCADTYTNETVMVFGYKIYCFKNSIISANRNHVYNIYTIMFLCYIRFVLIIVGVLCLLNRNRSQTLFSIGCVSLQQKILGVRYH